MFFLNLTPTTVFLAELFGAASVNTGRNAAQVVLSDTLEFRPLLCAISATAATGPSLRFSSLGATGLPGTARTMDIWTSVRRTRGPASTPFVLAARFSLLQRTAEVSVCL